VADDEQAQDLPDVVQRLDEVRDALSDLSEVLGQEEELGRVLQRGVDQLTRAIPRAEMASVSVLRGDSAETVAASNDQVWAVDSDQYAVGEGPGLEAARTGEIVRVSVEQATERWPEFARSARAAGVASYLSCPLIIDEKFAGALNLYSKQPHGFGDLDEALLRLYVTAATAAIANARRYAEARRLAEHLARALDSRAVVDQASGVLMALRGISAEEAFNELSRESQNTNTKLREIAARIVQGARLVR
jgi:GAF domain-containing protein